MMNGSFIVGDAYVLLVPVLFEICICLHLHLFI